jgi:sigma-B regulation protein RsbU (phosphoserine phosphatase)
MFAPMPSLIVTSGALAGQVFSFSDTAVVGRGQFSEVRLNDGTVSRRHALIRMIGDVYELSDQDSANGTRLRGERLVGPVHIKDGDEIEFGEIKAVFRQARGEHASLPSLRRVPERTTRTHGPKTGEAKAIPTPSAPAPPGLRDLLARLKLFCDLGALARREEPLREQLDRALLAILAAFPLLRHAAIYTQATAADHFAAIAQRSVPADALDLRHVEPFMREALRQEDGIDIAGDVARDALAARLRIEQLPTALLGLPLRIGADVLGGLYLDSDNEGAWRSADQELFGGVAGQLAWLIAGQRGRAPERTIEAHDLALARRIQQRFLPQSTPPIAGYRIADSYEAARVIGGDYFDFFQYRDGRQGWVIADVSGKSVSGALYMARLSVQVRALARHMAGPAELLSGLNKKLYQELEPGMFVTMLAAALEPEQGVLEFACAGHPPPILRAADGSVRELAEPDALPLGAMPDTEFRAHRAILAAGACVLFYTDGLDEAHNDKNELFGKGRIVETLANCRDAQDALDSLLANVARFAAGEAQSDDLTLITLSRDR